MKTKKMKNNRMKDICTSIDRSWPPENDVGNSSAPARNIPKSLLGGVIFGCKHSTMSECLDKQLFGMFSFIPFYIIVILFCFLLIIR